MAHVAAAADVSSYPPQFWLWCRLPPTRHSWQRPVGLLPAGQGAGVCVSGGLASITCFLSLQCLQLEEARWRCRQLEKELGEANEDRERLQQVGAGAQSLADRLLSLIVLVTTTLYGP